MEEAEGGLNHLQGRVQSQIWTEKEYLANSPMLSSEQYLLFVGNSKEFKNRRLNMHVRFSKFGMNYGWLGKQASLFIDEFVQSED